MKIIKFQPGGGIYKPKYKTFAEADLAFGKGARDAQAVSQHYLSKINQNAPIEVTSQNSINFTNGDNTQINGNISSYQNGVRTNISYQNGKPSTTAFTYQDGSQGVYQGGDFKYMPNYAKFDKQIATTKPKQINNLKVIR